MSILDEALKIKKIDQGNLTKIMTDLPIQFESVLKTEAKIQVPSDYQKVKNIVLVGMGCDRVVAEMVKQILSQNSDLPVEVVGDYQFPHYLNNETLLIFLSYSGNTPEILFFIKEIIKNKKRPKMFTILSGGALEKIVKKEKIPFYKFNGRGPSRANIGYLLFSLLILMKKIKLNKIEKFDLKNLAKKINELNKIFTPNKKIENNIAKFLACKIFDRLPIIVGANHLWPIANRWKKDFNENSKTFSFAEEAPELFHNTIVGLEYPVRLNDDAFFIFLESNFYHPKIKKAMTIFQKILKEKKIDFENIPAFSKTKEEEMLGSLILGDWISFYLAILNQVDPTPVSNIDQIKKQL